MVSFKFKQGFVIVGMSMYATSSAFGAIVNTVTVKGTAPGGAVDAVTATDTESVSVVAANSELTITKSYEFKPGYANADGEAEKDEIITYIFAVENTGNVTITDVKVIEGTFEGTSGVPVVPDNPTLTIDAGISNDSKDEINSSDDKWEILAPGDTVTFKGDYTIVQSDFDQLQN